MFLKVVKQSISFGDMIALYNATNNLSGNLSFVSSMVPELLTDALYINRLRMFLGYETKMINGSQPIPETIGTIEFKGVSFAYGDETVLNDISMTIQPGEKVAIVGYNGAGKTTLVKLLMRLYDPTKGEILLNGINIKEYDLASYRSIIGTVFQDYQIFASLLSENVSMDIDEGRDEQKIEALIKSGYITDSGEGPGALSTPLTKEFDNDGVNLSGGESQKVAIARTFYKSADYLVFDEPSSALDPISESNVYESMRNASEGKTVVFISHRLSSTQMADRVYMFEGGRVIEEGSHGELIEKGGKYAEMFELQAERYRGAF
jgi:ATP-binding cassette subfamily B protein